jgi:hypothetical protein
MFWFVRVNKREGVARKNGINGGNEIRGKRNKGNAILAYPFHDGIFKNRVIFHEMGAVNMSNEYPESKEDDNFII